jgi:hypothetical protein
MQNFYSCFYCTLRTEALDPVIISRNWENLLTVSPSNALLYEKAGSRHEINRIHARRTQFNPTFDRATDELPTLIFSARHQS